ncbi:coA-transferase family III domain-containing protein [Trichoderma breve]|uniref:CoA-transferase family III domain-containing protein n=1 Tax=Trichoderma breve TaxID=2034170 RepID=A0A9W9BFV4_9HYPO|nr:coA-transferase family III domain-containing protein [Trichoderma breve]KAJ4862583.1 coA-transferase family III domain-containing protein [Trichoderma breve]
MNGTSIHTYSSKKEALTILQYLCNQFDPISLPAGVASRAEYVQFAAERDQPYFPIPFKETETTAALKAIEASVATLLADTRQDGQVPERKIVVDLEKTTAFLFQAYLARVGGYGKLDKGVKSMLKDTDFLQAQSDPYRRMSANLYATKNPNEYYHIHGSLEASTTLKMIGLEPYRPDLATHEDIVQTIESAVKRFTVDELEELNAQNRQAGIKAYTHAEFLKTPHGKTNMSLPPWSVESLEDKTPQIPLQTKDNRLLSGIKVLELCRIIAGPTITRILGEYGAEVIKVTAPYLSDVPFFQVDGNMGKRATDLDLKSAEGREAFEKLLAEADVVVDGYRPGAIAKLGYGPKQLSELAIKRGKGFVYVNENCFGYEGEWASRPGWQQISDCVTGIAWEQGKFMGVNEPMVPPFPISDYGTGCIGAITALIGLYHRATRGGSWHGKVCLLHYDLLLFKVGLLPEHVQQKLRDTMGPEVLALRYHNSVDQISGTVLRRMREVYPDFVENPKYLDKWYADKYKAEVHAVKPVAEIEGLELGFRRASRPNGSDEAKWEVSEEKDYQL